MIHGRWRGTESGVRATARAPLLLQAARVVALLAALGACGGESPSGAPGVPTPPVVPPAGPVGPLLAGQSYTDAGGFVEFIPGDAPLIIVAPHGGTQSPSELPDRSCSGCVTVNDLNTQELARAIVDTFRVRTGVRPALLINRLHRRKFDGNRALAEATDGTAALANTWTWWHAAIDSAKANVVRRTSRGLLIDLHGHGHAIARLELGYLLNGTDLRAGDAALVANAAMGRTSVARLSGDTPSSADRGVPVLRGPRSLGAFMTARGYPAVPSPADPAPLAGQEYFEGGYNTERHGSLNGGALDAIQIECHLPGVRDSAAARAAFASALVTALLQYLDVHYGWRPA